MDIKKIDKVLERVELLKKEYENIIEVKELEAEERNKKRSLGERMNMEDIERWNNICDRYDDITDKFGDRKFECFVDIKNELGLLYNDPKENENIRKNFEDNLQKLNLDQIEKIYDLFEDWNWHTENSWINEVANEKRKENEGVENLIEDILEKNEEKEKTR